MSYTLRSKASRATLAVAATMCVARKALRHYLRDNMPAFFAIIVVPKDTDDYFRTAVKTLIGSTHRVDEHGDEVATVLTTPMGPIHVNRTLERLANLRQVVIIAEDATELSHDLIRAADFVTEVQAPTADHYMAAARKLSMHGMNKSIAETLAAASLRDVSSVVRQARPLLRAVAQLKRAKKEETPKPSKKTVKRSGQRLEDLAGYGPAKDWGMQLAQDLNDWRSGTISWDDVDKGALLVGPPGVGKTSYAEALANQCELSLVSTSAGRWQAKGHLGDMLKAMRSAFDEAEKKKPCLLFIDEFDSFGDRESAGDQDHVDYRRQVINSLLECLDPTEGREGVVVLGATNNASGIDRALLRSGRLETVVEIPLPDADDRAAIIRHHAKKDVLVGDLADVVDFTDGWSGADIARLVREARRITRRQKVAMSEAVLLQALPPTVKLTDDVRWRTAIHEAGHALISVALKVGDLRFVRIRREVGKGSVNAGHNQIRLPQKPSTTVEEFNDMIAFLLGGIAAETIMFSCYGSGAGGAHSSDLFLASDIATRIERHLGLGSSLSVELGNGDQSLERMRLSDPALRKLVDHRLKAQLDRAINILEPHHGKLENLASLLMDEEIVSGDRVRELFHAPQKTMSSIAS